ncbi:MAG: DNA translocase FtsK, partial [Firmicutes bacterium]|nr:DNA translocase FtsK [Bacillota bacterium]
FDYLGVSRLRTDLSDHVDSIDEYTKTEKKSDKNKNNIDLKREENIVSESSADNNVVEDLVSDEEILTPYEDVYGVEADKNNEYIVPEEAFDADKFLEEVAAQLPQTEGVREIMEGRKNAEASNDHPQRVSTTTEEERNIVSEEIDEAIAEVKEYVYPGFDLLRKPGTSTGDKRKEMLETSKKLMEILKNFGVEAKLLQVTNGPAVTRYEIQPTVGTKLSKITGLAEDIALNLAVPTVLVAPVPGKAAVGIEVPNNSIGLVSVREILESDEFRNSKSTLSVALGKDIGGRVIVGDIGKFPHILIAGSTGSGKSVCINTIITSILYKASPEEVKLIMVDPKVVELGVYNGIPHLLIPVVTDPKKAAGALNWAVREMLARYQSFSETGVRDINGYNQMKKDAGEEDLMPQIVIVIDELADLMMAAPGDVEDSICRLAQMARAAGMHLVIATQRPSVDVITGTIKANIPSRLAFAVSSGVDSRTILDMIGAEKLVGKGDMLFYPMGKSKPERMQGAFISDKEVENIVAFVKGNKPTAYDAEMIEKITQNNKSVDATEDVDEFFDRAIDLVVEKEKASVSMLQRQFRIGYNRAARLMEDLEKRGIVGPEDGSKPRKVLITKAELIEMRDPAAKSEQVSEEE